MSFTYGFYNYDPNDSGDDAKIYDAEQISKLFDGLITDGVFASIGSAFRVYPSPTQAENTVIIGTGKAWFNHTWNINDSDYIIQTPVQSTTYYRIDALVLDINNETRHNGFDWVQGEEAASNPVKPTISNTDSNHGKYPIAYITRRPNNSRIQMSDIEYAVGVDELTPFVTGLTSSINVADVVSQYIDSLNLPTQIEHEVTEQIGDLEFSVQRVGTPSNTDTSVEKIFVGDTPLGDIDGTMYMETSTYSTSGSSTTFTFTNDILTDDKDYSVSCDVLNVTPEDITITTGSATVSFSSSDNVTKCRLYIK